MVDEQSGLTTKRYYSYSEEREREIDAAVVNRKRERNKRKWMELGKRKKGR